MIFTWVKVYIIKKPVFLLMIRLAKVPIKSSPVIHNGLAFQSWKKELHKSKRKDADSMITLFYICI